MSGAAPESAAAGALPRLGRQLYIVNADVEDGIAGRLALRRHLEWHDRDRGGALHRALGCKFKT